MQPWGVMPDGRRVDAITLKNSANGMSATVLTYGATVSSIRVPSARTGPEEVTLCHDNLDALRTKSPYYGSTVGRVANRIAKGRFTLDGKVRLWLCSIAVFCIFLPQRRQRNGGVPIAPTLHNRFFAQEYVLAVNNPPNHLHGGIVAIDKMLWTPRVYVNGALSAARLLEVVPALPMCMGIHIQRVLLPRRPSQLPRCSSPCNSNMVYPTADKAAGVELKVTSAEGDEGYPGTLHVSATYELTSANELRMVFTANVEGSACPVNLCNHVYYNLTGELKDDIKSHVLTINAAHYLPKKDSVPSGEIAPVAGTAFDFTSARPVGERLTLVEGEEQPGYDHCFSRLAPGAPPKPTLDLEVIAVLKDPASGRAMSVYTDQVSAQLPRPTTACAAPHVGFVG